MASSNANKFEFVSFIPKDFYQRHPRHINLVFAGGAILGIAHVGVLKALEEQGFRPRSVAGTSSGALFGALVAAGYNAAELTSIVMHQNFLKFKDLPDGCTTFRRRISRFISCGGIYEGEALRQWMKQLLHAKLGKSPTFADLPVDLHIVATEISPRWGRLFRFARDTTPTAEVADAVRASASLPLLYPPATWRDHGSGKEFRFIDGGVLCNVPSYVFDRELDDTIVIGFAKRSMWRLAGSYSLWVFQEIVLGKRS